MSAEQWISMIHFAATWAMVGLIWFVQVVHYPLFAAVGREAFAEYQARHVRRTSLVVGPLMAAEATTAVALLALVGGTLPFVGLGLLAVVWTSTAVWQVPCHGRLERGFDARTHGRLVATNWLRTAAWTARGGVAAALVIA